MVKARTIGRIFALKNDLVSEYMDMGFKAVLSQAEGRFHILTILSPFIMEFIGTFFLVLVVGLNVTQKTPLGAIAIGSVLMVCVYAGGHISGAHYNPAVTLAVFLAGRNKISFLGAILYMLVQFFASLCASLVYWAYETTFQPRPGEGFSRGAAFGAEIMFTFLLVYVILQVATTKSQGGNSFFGLAIGFTLLVAAITIGPISGAVINPAVGLGPTLISVFDNGADDFKYIWVYTAGPYLGGFIAGITFRLTNWVEYRDDVDIRLNGKDTKSIQDAAVATLDGHREVRPKAAQEMGDMAASDSVRAMVGLGPSTVMPINEDSDVTEPDDSDNSDDGEDDSDDNSDDDDSDNSDDGEDDSDDSDDGDDSDSDDDSSEV